MLYTHYVQYRLWSSCAGGNNKTHRLKPVSLPPLLLCCTTITYVPTHALCWWCQRSSARKSKRSVDPVREIWEESSRLAECIGEREASLTPKREVLPPSTARNGIMWDKKSFKKQYMQSAPIFQSSRWEIASLVYLKFQEFRSTRFQSFAKKIRFVTLFL